jgi:PAS domain S-box-containing protein
MEWERLSLAKGAENTMSEEHTTDTQLLQELDRLRQRICQLEQAEKSVRESQARYRDLVQEMKDAIYTLDTQGTVTFVNEAGKEMFGRDPKEIIGKHFSNWIPKEQLPQAIAAFNRILAGQMITAETIMVDKRGKPHNVEFSSTPIIRDDKVVGTRGIIRDVTERKQTEQRLKDSEQALRSMFNAITESALLVETDGTVVAANQAAAERLGSSIKEIVGKNIYDFLAHNVAESRRLQANKIIQTGRPVVFEDIHLGKYLHNSVYPVKDSSGNVTKLAIFASDHTDCKKAEAALRASENKYRTLLENLPQKIFLKDKNSVYTCCNKNYADDLKIKPQEIAGKTDYDFYPKELAEKYRADDKQIIETGQIKDIEEKYIQNGQEFIVHTVKTPVRDEYGNNIAVLGIFWDITEKKRVEQALDDAKRRYQTLFDNAPVGIGIATFDGQVLQCNEAMLKITGYSATEITQINLANTHQNPRRRQELVNRLQKDGFVQDFEAHLKRKDGTLYYASVTVVPFVVGNQRVLLTVKQDITSRKAADEAIKQYQVMVESAHDAIFFKDLQSRYVIANKKALEAFGLSGEQVIGKNDYEIMADKKEARQNIQDDRLVFKTAKPTEFTKCMTGKDGQVRWFQALKVPQFDDSGNIVGLVGIARDITGAKQAEDELERYREKMAGSERLASLGTLSAMLAHELGQPLTVIGLSIENCLFALKKIDHLRPLGKELSDALDAVSNAASIIDRFRTFARKSEGKTVRKVNLRAVAERIVTLLSETAGRVKVTLVIRNFDELPHIYAYEKDIEQIFFMLTQNAIQAADGKKERRLTISAAATDEHIELRFADTCGGIASENLDRIFEPFFTTKSSSEATGLGLYIVQEIISRSGGKIRVKSKLGKGSTFFVTLPIKADK